MTTPTIPVSDRSRNRHQSDDGDCQRTAKKTPVHGYPLFLRSPARRRIEGLTS
jgi:hypothetical protein